MRSAKANVLCVGGLLLGIVAVGCGDSIQSSDSVAAMFGWVAVSCVCLAAALILCALGAHAENEEMSKREGRKIKRIPHHVNEWRDAQ